MQPKVEPGNRKVRLPFDPSIAGVFKVPRISLAEVATLGRRPRRIVLRLDYELAIEVEQRTVGDGKRIRIFCVWHAAQRGRFGVPCWTRWSKCRQQGHFTHEGRHCLGDALR